MKPARKASSKAPPTTPRAIAPLLGVLEEELSEVVEEESSRVVEEEGLISGM